MDVSAPPGQPEQAEGSRPVDAWRRRSPAHWITAAWRGEQRRPWDLHCFDPLGSRTRRCSEHAVAGGGGDAGSPPRGEHRSGAPRGGGRPGPPPPGRAPPCFCSFLRWGLLNEISLLVVLFPRSLTLLVVLFTRMLESPGELFTPAGGLPVAQSS
jgi:hypothetical protein